MTTLIGIATKDKKRAPMQTMECAYISVDKGVENDFRGKPSKRQVTVLSLSAWQEAIEIINTELPWTKRRANILVDELELENTAGQTITIGDVKLLITGETDPCERIREVADGLFDALSEHWRGGVCCRVISEGKVKLGDEVVLSDKNIK
jgi:MOSC domain-containing protein YiiM